MSTPDPGVPPWRRPDTWVAYGATPDEAAAIVASGVHATGNQEDDEAILTAYRAGYSDALSAAEEAVERICTDGGGHAVRALM